MDQQEPTLAERPQSAIRASLSLLRRNPDFRRLYLASVISYGGDWFLTVALFGLVLELSESPILASMIVVAQMLPFFFTSPFGGVLADRMDRQRLMVASDLARAVVIAGMLLVRGPELVWLAIALQAFESAFAGFFEPAATAAIPNLVDEEDLSTANALAGSAWGTMLAVGAALGGVVSATLGRDAAFIGDSFSFVVSALLLMRIRRKFNEALPEEHPGILSATVETIRYARKDKRVLSLIAVKGGFGLGGGFIVLLPLIATRVFDAGDIGIGLVMAARGMGALIGPFIGRALAGESDRRLFRTIGFALGSFGIFYAFFPLMPSLLLALPFATFAHLGGGAQWSLSTYGLQKMVPDYIRGRVFAFDVALITLTLALSNVGAGIAASLWGPKVAMGIGVGISMIYAAAWWIATRRVRRALTD
ncbi:MAG: MFS transporter [Actinomycetota bacterium]